MRKVGPAPALDVYEGGLAESSESQGEFARALTEVRAVSGALEVCYGRGEVAQTVLPDLPPTPAPATPAAATASQTAPAGSSAPIDTEVDGYLVGYDLVAPRPTRRRAASLLEQGRTPGEATTGHTADLKA